MTRILLIAPPFFDYYSDVIKQLKRFGFEVDWLNDRPSNSTLFKSLTRISYNLAEPNIDKYLNKIIRIIKSKNYDAIFALGGMSWCFNAEQTQKLRQATNAPFVRYLWDSVENCQRILDSSNMFDKVFSFDRKDCSQFGYEFLPLFYSFDTSEYSSIESYKYDACFIGSVHQISKFKHVKFIVDKLRKKGANVFTYYYMPSKFAICLRKLQDSVYQNVELTTKSLSREQTLRIYSLSKALIDSPQSQQHGLTIRSIESLGMNRRLITVNSDIKNYDFFRYGNISVVSGDDIPFPIKDPIGYPEEIRKKYSISNWLNVILRSIGVL